jgi:ribonuclease P protein component
VSRLRESREHEDSGWWNATRCGFPRAARLVRRADFDAVYQQGRRRSSKQFVVFYRASGRELSRFGMSVKSSLGGAVVRNRMRRRIREILRLHCQEIATGWDIVIHPRSSVATAAFASLATELVELLRAALVPAAEADRP